MRINLKLYGVLIFLLPAFVSAQVNISWQTVPISEVELLFYGKGTSGDLARYNASENSPEGVLAGCQKAQEEETILRSYHIVDAKNGGAHRFFDVFGNVSLFVNEVNDKTIRLISRVDIQMEEGEERTLIVLEMPAKSHVLVEGEGPDDLSTALPVMAPKMKEDLDSGPERVRYIAVLHKIEGVWKLVRPFEQGYHYEFLRFFYRVKPEVLLALLSGETDDPKLQKIVEKTRYQGGFDISMMFKYLYYWEYYHDPDNLLEKVFTEEATMEGRLYQRIHFHSTQ